MHIITKIEQQKKNIHRYSVFLNEEYSFSISEDTLVKLRLKKSMEIDKDRLDYILEQEEIDSCKAYGLKLLSYKARNEYEIKDKMLKKGYNENHIEEAIKYLREQNYIDDEEYAKNYIQDRVKIKKLGYNRIKGELFQKRIDGEIIEDTLNELIDMEDEYKRALELAEKKVNTTYRNDDTQAVYRKLGGFLQRKGYSMDIIIKVLNKILKHE
ncbi:RecX family transcriptional regulator [Proteiniborus sp. MB09-C3]|uniref:regulatory protein RecX n=1 Tax=Proteiniborus sp. MB09-C3 TaxID=3050072 RepID=UPI0025569585|nr:RecX family transcriptional regulator [Proteiniborus sp. MB09-C3]WIV13841.1 RecX family transcriptional regulator [Proteiniborus sp. MB09-C3]